MISQKSCKKSVYLVSACLAGLKTRYDGRCKINTSCLKDLEGCCWVPFCPEQLGGLATPRPAADIVNGDGKDVLTGRAQVITIDDDYNVTNEFIRGAEQVIQLAEFYLISAVYLKARSPSCGLSPRLGVTAALLIENGYKVIEY